MSRTLVMLLLLAAAVTGLAMTVRAQQDAPIPEPEPATASPSPSPTACPPDRILVKLQPGADPVTVIERHGGTIIQTIPGIEVHVVTVPGGTGQQAIDALNADPDVQYAEPDGVVRISAEGDGC